jgi:hypothetical protein
MTQLLDELAEFFWEIDALGKTDNKEEFLLKAKPIIKSLIESIRQGGNL